MVDLARKLRVENRVRTEYYTPTQIELTNIYIYSTNHLVLILSICISIIKFVKGDNITYLKALKIGHDTSETRVIREYLKCLYRRSPNIVSRLIHMPESVYISFLTQYIWFS